MAWLLQAFEALIELVPIKCLLITTTHDPKIRFKDVRAAPTQLMSISSRPKDGLIVVAIFLRGKLVRSLKLHIHRCCGVGHCQFEQFARYLAFIVRFEDTPKELFRNEVNVAENRR